MSEFSKGGIIHVHFGLYPLGVLIVTDGAWANGAKAKVMISMTCHLTDVLMQRVIPMSEVRRQRQRAKMFVLG